MSLFDRLAGAPFLEMAGDGVVLRTPTRRDYQEWASLRGESRAFLEPWEPLWSADELTVTAYRSRLARYAREARENSSFTFFLFSGEGQTLYGGMSLGHIRRGVAQSGTIGYWMGERYAGRGLMRRGVELIKMFAFDVQNLHRIEAACLPHNERSIHLLEKSGFQREGLLRGYLKIAGRWEDHVLYSALAEDWLSQRRPLSKEADT